MKPITEVGEKLGIPADALMQFGPTKAKLSYDYLESIKKNKDGKLILVTATSPTPAGEGKTTTTVGLGDGLNRIGKMAMMCLREPSLGPCFVIKGRAHCCCFSIGVPMVVIIPTLTRALHALTSAPNLITAL